jgi:PIF1-like helicase
LNCHLVCPHSNRTFINLFIDLCMPVGRETVEALIYEIYSDLHHITSPMSESAIREYFSQRVILAARNVDVDAINETILRMLPGEAKTYSRVDSAFIDAGIANDAIPNEYLNMIAVPGIRFMRPH